MSVIEKAKQHFRNQISNRQDSVVVPEWGVTLWYKPMNAKQRDAVFKLANEGKYHEAMVENIIMRALDEDGKPVFKMAEKVEMMRSVDPDVIARVSSSMGLADETDNLEGEKLDPKDS